MEAKNTLPILTMARLTATSDRLTITTSNLDIEYRQVIAATSTADMDFCVDAKRLLAMAGAAKGAMTFEPSDNQVVAIKAGRSRWSAPSLPAGDYPSMPVDKLCPAMKVAGEEIADIIKRTVWAAPDEMAKASLGGVFLNDEGGHARYVATDANALASIETETAWPKDAPNVIVPIALCNVIANASDDAGEVALAWDERKLRFEAGDVTITGKMIDGNFPDYRRIFPEPCEPYAVDAGDLRDGVRRVRIASDAKTRRLRIERKKGALHIRIEGTSGFEGSEEIPADCENGFETAVNADLLVSMLAAVDCETVTVEQEDALKIMVLRPVSQPKGVSFTGLIMPMRI